MIRAPLHFHHLREVSKSPAHFAAYIRSEEPQTATMGVGRALHEVVLSGVVATVYPGAVRRGKEWEAFRSENEGSLILSRSERELVMGMADSLSRHRRATELLAGQREQLISWEMRGRPCEGHPDAFDVGRVVDLKTSRSAHPGQFRWDARRHHYPEQLAWYRAGLRANQHAVDDAYLVVVESRAPYPVVVYDVTGEMARATGVIEEWLDRVAECELLGEWPSYADGDVPLSLDCIRDTDMVLSEDDDEF